MTIRQKIAVNMIVFALIATYLAYRELLVFHPNLFGV